MSTPSGPYRVEWVIHCAGSGGWSVLCGEITVRDGYESAEAAQTDCDMLIAAYRAGAEQMRERCAKEAEWEKHRDVQTEVVDVCESIQFHVRSIPLVEGEP